MINSVNGANVEAAANKSAIVKKAAVVAGAAVAVGAIALAAKNGNVVQVVKDTFKKGAEGAEKTKLTTKLGTVAKAWGKGFKAIPGSVVAGAKAAAGKVKGAATAVKEKVSGLFNKGAKEATEFVQENADEFI